MSDYINIIRQEAMTDIPDWITILLGGLCIGAVLSTFIYWAIVKDAYKVMRYLFSVGFSAMGFFVIAYLICSIFVQVPTGKYKYEATIDKDKITVSQYEEFIEEYNPSIKDGIYYWEE